MCCREGPEDAWCECCGVPDGSGVKNVRGDMGWLLVGEKMGEKGERAGEGTGEAGRGTLVGSVMAA